MWTVITVIPIPNSRVTLFKLSVTVSHVRVWLGQASDAKLLDAIKSVSGDLDAVEAREGAHYGELTAGINAQNDKEVLPLYIAAALSAAESVGCVDARSDTNVTDGAVARRRVETRRRWQRCWKTARQSFATISQRG